MKWICEDGEFNLYNKNNCKIANFYMSRKKAKVLYVNYLNNSSKEISISHDTAVENVKQMIESEVVNYLNSAISHYSEILNDLKGEDGNREYK